jgi:hypothetical protein
VTVASAARHCDWCNRLYAPDPEFGGQVRFCSRECLYADRKVPLEAVYQRDGGICHLCGHHVPWRSASRDHLRPRKFGGRITWANVALAHRTCNTARDLKPLPSIKACIPAIPRMLPSRRLPVAQARA